MSCQYCKFAVSARGAFWPTLVCENEFGFEGLWRQVYFTGACENFSSHESGYLGGDSDVRYIPLSQGKVAIVDVDDYPSLIRYKWCTARKPKTFYVSGKINGRSTFMHRFIMAPPKPMVVDHINHNGLDNRRSNLRICTTAQNARNCRPYAGKKVKYKGVSFNKSRKKFRVFIRYGEVSFNLGYFDDEVEAARAYDKKAKELFKEYAYLNFPEEKEA